MDPLEVKRLKNSAHLLIVEDEAEAREFLSLELRRQDYQVSVASSAEEALSIMEKNRIQLVLSDIAMPHMSGLELLEVIKKKYTATEVILITGHATIESTVEAMRKGAFDYIAKPFHMNEVIIRIEKALQSMARRERFLMLEEKVESLKQVCTDLQQSQDQRTRSEKLASISRLVSGIAHEINNPLTAVIGYTQLLLDSENHENDRQLKLIRDQADRCGKIIQDLLIFARKCKPNLHLVDLVQILNGVIQESKKEIDRLGIHLQLNYPSKMEIMGDETQLRRVIQQIVSNALQAVEEIKEERLIEIAIHENSSKEARIDIKDNGPGIAQEHLSRIFDPFFTTKEVGKGTGLGLSLCHGLVEGHGGRILASSQLGKGTLLSVILPKAPGEVPLKEVSVPASPEKKRRLLVIEDEVVIANFIRRVFLTHGFDVSVALDGDMALQELRKQDFDAVLCDYLIPKINGIQLFERIRKEKEGMEKKFIFVTAAVNFQETQDDDYFEKNGLGFLPKPFTAQEVTALVESRIRASVQQ